MALKTLRPERVGFGDPFGLGLLPDFQQQTTHLKKKFSLHRGAKEDSFPRTKSVHPLPMNLKTPTTSIRKMEELPPPNYNFHVFYYSWYGTPQFDGKYIHWNHPLLTHWDPKIASGYPKGRHNPPEDIGSSFYPELGPYSSRDPSVIEAHMKQMRSASIGKYSISFPFAVPHPQKLMSLSYIPLLACLLSVSSQSLAVFTSSFQAIYSSSNPVYSPAFVVVVSFPFLILRKFPLLALYSSGSSNDHTSVTPLLCK